MKYAVTGMMLAALAAAGCSGPEPVAPESTATETDTAGAPGYTAPPMRDFAPVTIGPYQVQPMYEEEIADGHFNLRVTGGDFAAIRIWVGEEEPGEVMVVKTELENGYQHGHLEIPQPIPAGYALWIEIETPDGTLLKGSTPLEPAV